MRCDLIHGYTAGPRRALSQSRDVVPRACRCGSGPFHCSGRV